MKTRTPHGRSFAPILIAGPTASGKSALALETAVATGAIVVNADSQQLYRDWRILTARPGPADEARAEHRLYGTRALEDVASAGSWLRDVAAMLSDCRQVGRRAIVVGGTGLYFRALTEGLAPVPAVPDDVRQAAQVRLADDGLTSLAAELRARDPETASALDLANPKRVLRALEVLDATGLGLAAWQARSAPPICPIETAIPITLVPDRGWLDQRIDVRFEGMMADGALEEVARVMALGLPADLPGMKALGAPELMAHLRDEISLDLAVDRAKLATRRYAKRQLTWIRNQMGAWRHLPPPADGPDRTRLVADILA